MQTMFLGESSTTTNGEGVTPGENGGGIVGQLKAAADDLRAASDMLRQNTQAQPTYGGPNGGRPRFNGDGTKRPGQNHDYGGGYAGYNGLRRSLITEAAARYGSTGGMLTRGNTYQAHYDRYGQVEYYTEHSQNGNLVGVHQRNSPTFGEAQTIFNRQQNANRIIGQGAVPHPFTVTGANGEVHTPGVSTTQHIVNSVGGFLGPVGKGVAAVVSGLIGAPDAIMNGVVNERAKNAQFQAILGGTNFGTGFHNRRLEAGFKLSQLYSGGLTGAMSEEAFRGVTNLGYTGNDRNSALGLITSNYKNLGMGVDDSLKLIGIMAQSSSTSFEQLKTVLNETSQAAKNTGQNLELARNNLTNLFAVATGTLGGQGALQTSGLLSGFQTQLGRNFAGVDFSGLLPGNNIGLTALQATSVGMPLSQYEMLQAGGGSQARALQEQASDKLLAMSVSPTVGIVQPVVNKLLQQAGGLKAVTSSNDSWQNFVQNVMRNPDFIKSGVNLPALKAQIKSYTGATMNDQQAIEWLLRQSVGVGASFSAVDKQQKNAMLQTRKPGAYQYMIQTNKAGHVTSGHYVPVKSVPDKVNDPILNRFKDKFYNENTHVIVQTAQGEKVVSGTYALDHLKDQIARGTAKFIGGQYDGQTVAQVVGGGYAESNYKGQNTTHVSGKDASHFHSVKEYQKIAAKNNGSGGKVIIAPNPALAQLLNITATGNVAIANEGAQWGYAPKPGQVGVYLGN